MGSRSCTGRRSSSTCEALGGGARRKPATGYPITRQMEIEARLRPCVGAPCRWAIRGYDSSVVRWVRDSAAASVTIAPRSGGSAACLRSPCRMTRASKSKNPKTRSITSAHRIVAVAASIVTLLPGGIPACDSFRTQQRKQHPRRGRERASIARVRGRFAHARESCGTVCFDRVRSPRSATRTLPLHATRRFRATPGHARRPGDTARGGRPCDSSPSGRPGGCEADG